MFRAVPNFSSRTREKEGKGGKDVCVFSLLYHKKRYGYGEVKKKLSDRIPHILCREKKKKE